MQVERKDLDIVADTVMTEVESSEKAEDASQGESEHEKLVDVSGIAENVIDDMETTQALPVVLVVSKLGCLFLTDFMIEVEKLAGPIFNQIFRVDPFDLLDVN